MVECHSVQVRGRTVVGGDEEFVLRGFGHAGRLLLQEPFEAGDVRYARKMIMMALTLALCFRRMAICAGV